MRHKIIRKVSHETQNNPQGRLSRTRGRVQHPTRGDNKWSTTHCPMGEMNNQDSISPKIMSDTLVHLYQACQERLIQAIVCTK